MDNHQILNIIARKMNLEASTVERLMEGFATVIAEQCQQEHRIAIPALGSFFGQKHDETVVKDLTTGQRLLLPPAIELEFMPGGRLKNTVAEGRNS